MSRSAIVWPGIALTMTLLDDFVAGPLLALTGRLLGPVLGIAVSVVAFTALIAGLALSVHLAAEHMDPPTRARIETAVHGASRHRLVGPLVRQVGDHRPIATALVAMVVSPVLAVLVARLAHPGQRGRRTLVVAVLAYGLAFSIAYAGGGSAIAAIG